MTRVTLPLAYRVEREGTRLLVAHDDVRAAAHALGLLHPDGLTRVLANADDAARELHTSHATKDAHATKAASATKSAHTTTNTNAETRARRGRGATYLLRWPASGQRVLVRRLWHGGVFGALLGDRFRSPARPLRELAVTCALRARGVALPEPLFVAGERRAGFWRLVFATRFETETRDALAWLRARPTSDALRAGVTAAAQSIRKLHDAGGLHPDLHLKNLLLRERGARATVIVIDLDAATVRAALTPRARMAQLMRLYRSIVKHGLTNAVGATTPARFLRAYCGADRALESAMRKRLRPELRRIALHRAGYALAALAARRA